VGKDSKIEWTDHTFNPWWGCAQVSPACDHCYAMTLAQRFGQWWGGDAPRRFFGPKHWREPVKWNERCERTGTRARVFCASMADVFDNHPDVIPARAELWKLIEATPHLDWLLLTKRIGNAHRMLPGGWFGGHSPGHYGRGPLPNVWLGATVVTRDEYERDVPKLRALPAAVRFLSIEPLLEPLGDIDLTGIHWVIVGGESGRQARSMRLWWVESIRDQCDAAGVAFFFKQWGEWAPRGENIMQKVGKLIAGRTLGGRTWDQVPHA
jgi:protein gp37